MRPEPVFEAPWHAQLFAMTVHLQQTGVIDWPGWTERLGAALAERGAARDLDGGDDYFAAWLAALEGLLAERGHCEPAAVEHLRAAWEDAYLHTPHGAPVHLEN